jgi:hypothetical protein
MVGYIKGRIKNGLRHPGFDIYLLVGSPFLTAGGIHLFLPPMHSFILEWLCWAGAQTIVCIVAFTMKIRLRSSEEGISTEEATRRDIEEVPWSVTDRDNG